MGAFLAAAAMFSAGQAPQSGGQAAVVRTMQQGNQKDTAPPVTQSNFGLRNFAIPRSGAVFSRSGYEPVWIGVEKRGNRRNRSRFNYNR